MIRNVVEQKRKEKNLTQVELALSVGVSRQTIIAVEKGNYSPSLELAFKIAATLKVSIDTLFTYEK